MCIRDSPRTVTVVVVAHLEIVKIKRYHHIIFKKRKTEYFVWANDNWDEEAIKRCV